MAKIKKLITAAILGGLSNGALAQISAQALVDYGLGVHLKARYNLGVISPVLRLGYERSNETTAESLEKQQRYLSASLGAEYLAWSNVAHSILIGAAAVYSKPQGQVVVGNTVYEMNHSLSRYGLNIAATAAYQYRISECFSVASEFQVGIAGKNPRVITDTNIVDPVSGIGTTRVEVDQAVPLGRLAVGVAYLF